MGVVVHLSYYSVECNPYTVFVFGGLSNEVLELAGDELV